MFSNTSLPDLQNLLYSRYILLSDIIMPVLNKNINLQKIEPDIIVFKNNLLFFIYLRSRFSSCFSKQENNNHKILQMQYSPIQNIYYFIKSNFNSIKFVKRDVIEIFNKLLSTKKFCIILRLYSLKVKTKPKIILRLEKLNAKSSTKQLKKVIIDPNADGYIDLKNSQNRRR